MYEIIIIGGGPAGLTAANNTSHRGLKTLLLESKKDCGGQPFNLFPNKIIKDHPGFPNGVTGKELSQRLLLQAKAAGAEIHTNEGALSIRKGKNSIKVITNIAGYEAKKVIIATGMLNVAKKHPILNKQPNQHINQCVVKKDFKSKNVVIVGGGDAAFDNALQIAEIAKSVRIIVRKAHPKAKESTVELAKKKGVKIGFNTDITGIKLKGGNIDYIIAHDKKIKADEAIVCIGYESARNFLKAQKIELRNDGSVKVNRKFETNIKGVFAAGDITGEIKLIAVACSEGISAAIHAFEEIKKPYWLH